LSEIKHITSVRIRSLKFNYSPKEYNFGIINKLGEFNIISSIISKRIEIETQFLSSLEIKEEHKELTRRLGKKGISVYNNTPFIKGVNNSREEIEKISNHLRECGIEFNVIYINRSRDKKRTNNTSQFFRYFFICEKIRKWKRNSKIFFKN
jgi:L-lysine 2,3-aminomutase